jgi:hypothetical protein
MGWLEAHAYLAAWLSPLVTLIGIIAQNKSGKTEPIAWPTIMIYIAFLTCLAAVFTPQFDLPTRFFASFSMSTGLGYFMMHK